MKRSSPEGGSECSDSMDDETREARLRARDFEAMQQEAIQALKAPPGLRVDDGFDKDFFNEDRQPWFISLPTSVWLDLLNFTHPKTGAYLIGFEKLAEIACSSQLLHLLFNDIQPNHAYWRECLQARLPMREKVWTKIPPKFGYLPVYLKKNRDVYYEKLKCEGLIAQLNMHGQGYCGHCGMMPEMQVKINHADDSIWVSPFRIMETLVTEFDNSLVHKSLARNNTSPIPDWVRNYLVIRGKMISSYCCVNPKCGKVLNQPICGVPLAAVFEGCGTSRNKHRFQDLSNDLLDPKGKNIPGEWLVCIHCGVLDFGQEEGEENACLACLLQPSECKCVPCPLCENPLGSCDCVICKDCDKCQAKCNKACKKNACDCGSADSTSFSESSYESSDQISISESSHDSE